MKQIEKRLTQLESTTHEEPVMTSLGEYYEWEQTPEGQTALNELYPTDQEAERMMQEYHHKLKQRGLL